MTVDCDAPRTWVAKPNPATMAAAITTTPALTAATRDRPLRRWAKERECLGAGKNLPPLNFYTILLFDQ